MAAEVRPVFARRSTLRMSNRGDRKFTAAGHGHPVWGSDQVQGQSPVLARMRRAVPVADAALPGSAAEAQVCVGVEDVLLVAAHAPLDDVADARGVPLLDPHDEV